MFLVTVENPLGHVLTRTRLERETLEGEMGNKINAPGSIRVCPQSINNKSLPHYTSRACGTSGHKHCLC